MADKAEPESEEQEKTIPLLTVLKNNAILKNIFLLDNAIAAVKNGGADPQFQEFEETLLVGRHPDCNITLEHPSISRFHLRLHSKPYYRKLSVIDLSSVHGTWVKGKRIEPGLQVELNEGDMMQIGGSSRVYRLHWVPLSLAYDIENPFVSPSDMCEQMEDKEQEATHKDEIGTFHENNQLQSLDYDDLEGLDYKVPDENSILLFNNKIPEPPFADEETESKSTSNKDLEKGIPNILSRQVSTESKTSTLSDGILLETEYQQLDEGKRSTQNLEHAELEQTEDILESLAFLFSHEHTEYHKCSLGVEHKSPFISNESKEKISSPDLDFVSGSEGQHSENKCSLGVQQEQHELPDVNFVSEIESQQLNKESESQKENALNIWSRRGKPSSDLKIQTGTGREKSKKDDFQFGVDLPHKGEVERNEVLKALFTVSDSDEEAFTPDKENCTPNTLGLRSMKKIVKAEGQSKVSMSHNSSSLKRKGGISKNSFTGLNENDGPFIPDKENFTQNIHQVRSIVRKSKMEDIKISKNLFSGLNENDEPFTPDKENYTPNTRLIRSMVRNSKMEDVKDCNSHRSSYVKNILAPSIQGNSAPKFLQLKLTRTPSEIQKNPKTKLENRRSTERIPFQPLFVHSSGKSKSDASALSSKAKSSNSMNCAQFIEVNENIAERKRIWQMVIDTTCLLNKESRKALQLLQGLKGTQLIIPGIVIRELDSMNRQGSLFRRKTEASCALQWIEECMVNSNWWIHVQNSEEEGWPIAPTPPASPQSRFSEVHRRLSSGAARLVAPFSAWGSLLEIVSPTAEDHVLECALLFRRIEMDGQLVLLTKDVTLKIKGMAEGLICETAEEFRESLVNPFSERFLWNDSSPRGLTWSCADDVVLKEKFYGCPSRKSGGEGAQIRGLKLILLHNSRYAQTSVTS